MAGSERFAEDEAVLELGGCAEPPVVPPAIRGRPNLPGGDSPLATETLAPPREGFPLLARPATGSSGGPKAWAAAARRLIDARLEEFGAILLRGLPLASAAEFSEFHLALGYEPMPYHGFATRNEIAPGVCTGNRPNPAQTIMLHNDMSHDPWMPAHVFLFCAKAPPEGAGGETPILRSLDWSAALGPELCARFAERRLARFTNCRSRDDTRRSGIPWQERYETDDPSQAEARCVGQGDLVEWETDGSMTTRRIVDAFRMHRGEEVWCCTPQSTRPVSPIDLRYGDGEPMEPELIQHIRTLQWNLSVAFAWQQGDVLCLDNIGCQHGRLPFEEGAEREVLVSIATPRPGTCRMPARSAEA